MNAPPLSPQMTARAAVELLTLGDELLDGRTADGNTLRVARALETLGLSLNRRTTFRDDRVAIAQAFQDVSRRADLCIVSGGLGPTTDDVTVAAMALAADVELVFDQAQWDRIVARFAPQTPPENNRRQARIPFGATALSSDVGTAPGIYLELGGCTFFLLPGVPDELQWHLDHHVVPMLARHLAQLGLVRKRPTIYLRCVGIGESALAQRIEALPNLAWVEIGYRAGELDLELSLRGDDPEEVERFAQAVEAVGAGYVIGRGRAGLAERVVDAFRERGLTFGAAESCTGGLLGATLTGVPGASDVFRGGIVAYANEAKTALLGVEPALLAEHGAVSETCAQAMAEGARRLLKVDIAVSITGIAGPGVGTDEKPVGTVCIGVAGPHGVASVVTTHLRGARERVRQQSVARALEAARRAVLSLPILESET